MRSLPDRVVPDGARAQLERLAPDSKYGFDSKTQYSWRPKLCALIDALGGEAPQSKRRVRHRGDAPKGPRSKGSRRGFAGRCGRRWAEQTAPRGGDAPAADAASLPTQEKEILE